MLVPVQDLADQEKTLFWVIGALCFTIALLFLFGYFCLDLDE